VRYRTSGDVSWQWRLRTNRLVAALRGRVRDRNALGHRQNKGTTSRALTNAARPADVIFTPKAAHLARYVAPAGPAAGQLRQPVVKAPTQERSQDKAETA
jgi:hypothetical protein